MLFGKHAGRHRFAKPLSGNGRLEMAERLLRPKISSILENGRSRVAVGIVYAVVHRQDCRLSRIF